MKNLKGNLFIFFTVVITFALWFFAVPVKEIVPLDRARHIIAGLALSGFFLNFLLATRNKVLEKWFNGLDKVYVYHRYIAISTVGLLLVHVILGEQLKTSDQITVSTVTGGLAMGLLVVLAGIAMFNKKLKYEDWRFSHRLMLVAYIIGLYHTFVSSKYNLLQLSGLGIWVWFTAVIGVMSAFYIVFFYQKTKFVHKGRVTKLTRLGSSIIEWEITLDSPIHFERGQFIFIKVFQKGFEEAPHPFSISGGTENKINLTTKVSGDFTKQVYDLLEVNTPVSIDGPYGFMDFNAGKQNQLWVAGGIGITPFMAYLRDNQVNQSIEMFYSYQGEDAGVYKDFLEEYQQKNKQFKVHLIDTSKMKFLSFEDYTLKDDTSIFMCGPEKMVKSYEKFFKKNYKNVDLRFEAFNFR
ncbi:MAG: ferric reductase-like transmembrane domain-containing protein [Anaerolineaceae bacterium]